MMTRLHAIAVALFMLAQAAQAAQTDTRICYTEPSTIPRNADGSIRRSSAVRNAFIRVHPCPSTRLSAFPCDGWQIDHVIPLACGGCDAVFNMQWLPVAIKASRDVNAKDRWELRVYCWRAK